MSRRQREQREAAASRQAASWNFLRRLTPLLLGVALLALSVNLYWWWQRPQLEPLPAVAMDSLEPGVQTLIKQSLAEVESHPRVAEAWGVLGSVLRAHELGVEAEVCYRNAERLDEADYRWPYLLGVSLTPTDAEQAVDCFRRAAQRCGDKPHVQLRLAEMLIERRLYDEATPLVTDVLRHSSRNARGQLAQARLLFAEGKLEEAKSWAEKSAARAPNRRAPHLLLAQLCRRTEDRAGEARALAILAEIPDGITPWEDPDVADVLDLRQNAGMENPALQLAGSYFEQQDFASAAAALRRELKKSPDNERLHFQLGVACFQQQQYDAAAAAFRRTIELKGDHVDAHYNLGHALVKLGRYEPAREAFAGAIQLRPSHAFARINLADLLLQSGDKAAAREHLEIAVELAPEEERARELLARCRE